VAVEKFAVPLRRIGADLSLHWQPVYATRPELAVVWFAQAATQATFSTITSLSTAVKEELVLNSRYANAVGFE